MRQSVRDIWTEFNAPLEGRLHFMYLDIKGLVTTGMGNLIDATGSPPLRPPTDSERAASHELARQLAWQASDGSSASPDQIDAEWDQIKARLDQAHSAAARSGSSPPCPYPTTRSTGWSLASSTRWRAC